MWLLFGGGFLCLTVGWFWVCCCKWYCVFGFWVWLPGAAVFRLLDADFGVVVVVTWVWRQRFLLVCCLNGVDGVCGSWIDWFGACGWVHGVFCVVVSVCVGLRLLLSVVGGFWSCFALWCLSDFLGLLLCVGWCVTGFVVLGFAIVWFCGDLLLRVWWGILRV